MSIIRKITTLPRRVQPVRHILSREQRHREIEERAGQFEELLKREKRKQMNKRK